MNRMKSFNSQNDIQMPRYDYKIGHLILVDSYINFIVFDYIKNTFTYKETQLTNYDGLIS